MGKPNAGNAALSLTEFIGDGWAPGEVKHLSTQRKRKRTARRNEAAADSFRRCFILYECIPLVVANERGTAQTVRVKPL